MRLHYKTIFKSMVRCYKLLHGLNTSGERMNFAVVLDGSAHSNANGQ